MNLFNALNGKEAKQAILNEVTRALDQDSEFKEHLTFPRVSWSWTLTMNIYPRTPPEKIVAVEGDAIQVIRDENGQLVPVMEESETHVKEVLQSAPREVVAPDAVREAEGLQTQTAAIGGVRTARTAEVGTAAKNPLMSPRMNRG